MRDLWYGKSSQPPNPRLLAKRGHRPTDDLDVAEVAPSDHGREDVLSIRKTTELLCYSCPDASVPADIIDQEKDPDVPWRRSQRMRLGLNLPRPVAPDK